MKILYKTGVLAAGAILAVGALGACSSSSSDNASPSASPTTSSPSPTETNQVGATCDENSLQSVVPQGANIDRFACGGDGDGQVAAVKYSPGTNVVFAKTTGVGGNWEIVNKDTICGTASAGLPAKLLAFCNS